MKIVEGDILMFKAAPDYSEIDYFEKKLQEAGYATHYIPVLEFAYCHLDILEESLRKPNEFSGLIFTSPRGVKAVSHIPYVSDLMVEWQKLAVFAVGEETSRVIKLELGLDAQGCDAGNASALADIILQSKYMKPFLFPCGNLKHDTLPIKLSDGGVNVTPVTVYETKTHHLLEQMLHDIILQSSSFPQIVIYFSPSGVRSTLPILLKLEVPLHMLKLQFAMSKREHPSPETPLKHPYALQSSLQRAMINAYKHIKLEAEEDGICLGKVQIISRVAKLMGHGYNSVKKVIDRYENGMELVTPGKHRKRSRRVTGVDDFTKEALARYIYSELNEGERVTTKLVYGHVKENYDTYEFDGSLVSLRKIIKEMGFKWSKEDSLTYVRESPDILFKRTCFLREYVRNLESENPKPVVFLDETWIFMNGSTTYSWNKPGKAGGVVTGIMRRPAEGGRLVIVHAGTKAGFIQGADLIFASNLKRGQDYHGAMNSETFQKWVKTKLIVGLRELGQPCMIVIDNASYHNKLVEQQPTTKWKKDELVTWLRQNGVAVPDNANKVELQTLCKMNQSRLKRYAVDEMLANEGHTVLRLPPYHSFFNAIELVWSVAKQYYNKNVASRPGHGLDRAKSVWKEALNHVTEEIWKNEVKHTEDKILKFYNDEVKNAPEVEEFVIDLADSGSDNDEDIDDTVEDTEDLASPLEPEPGTSK